VHLWFDVEMTLHAAATLVTSGAEALPKEGDIILF
jgi:hypothetical protein